MPERSLRRRPHGTLDEQIVGGRRQATLRRQREPELLGPFAQAGQLGMAQLRAMAPGTAAAVGGALGFEDFAEEQAGRAADIQARAAERAPDVLQFTDLRDPETGDIQFGDIPRFIGQTLLTQGPVLAAQFGGAAVGGAVGATARTAARGRASAQALRRQGEPGVTRAPIDRPAQAPVGRLTEAAPQIGALTGGATAGGALMAGDIAPRAILDADPDTDLSIQQRAQLTLGGSVLGGGLQTIPLGAAINRLGLGRAGARGLDRHIGRRMARGIAGQTAAEVPVDIAQAAISRGVHSFVNENIELLDDEGLMEILNAAAASAVTAVPTGGLTALRGPPRDTPRGRLHERIEARRDQQDRVEHDRVTARRRFERLQRRDPERAAEIEADVDALGFDDPILQADLAEADFETSRDLDGRTAFEFNDTTREAAGQIRATLIDEMAALRAAAQRPDTRARAPAEDRITRREEAAVREAETGALAVSFDEKQRVLTRMDRALEDNDASAFLDVLIDALIDQEIDLMRHGPTLQRALQPFGAQLTDTIRVRRRERGILDPDDLVDQTERLMRADTILERPGMGGRFTSRSGREFNESIEQEMARQQGLEAPSDPRAVMREDDRDDARDILREEVGLQGFSEFDPSALDADTGLPAQQVSFIANEKNLPWETSEAVKAVHPHLKKIEPNGARKQIERLRKLHGREEMDPKGSVTTPEGHFQVVSFRNQVIGEAEELGITDQQLQSRREALRQELRRRRQELETRALAEEAEAAQARVGPPVPDPLAGLTQAERNRQVDPHRDDLLLAIQKLGGLDTAIETDYAGRLSHLQRRGIGLRGLERPGREGARTLDDLRVALYEQGFLQEPSHDELVQLLERASAGEEIVSLQGADRVMRQEARERDEEQLQVLREDREQALEQDPEFVRMRDELHELEAVPDYQEFLAERARELAASLREDNRPVAQLFDENDPAAFLDNFEVIQQTDLPPQLGPGDQFLLTEAEILHQEDDWGNSITRSITSLTQEQRSGRQPLPRGMVRIQIDGREMVTNVMALARPLLNRMPSPDGRTGLTDERVAQAVFEALAQVANMPGQNVDINLVNIPDDTVVFAARREDGREWRWGDIKHLGAARYDAQIRHLQARLEQTTDAQLRAALQERIDGVFRLRRDARRTENRRDKEQRENARRVVANPNTHTAAQVAEAQEFLDRQAESRAQALEREFQRTDPEERAEGQTIDEILGGEAQVDVDMARRRLGDLVNERQVHRDLTILEDESLHPAETVRAARERLAQRFLDAQMPAVGRGEPGGRITPMTGEQAVADARRALDETRRESRRRIPDVPEQFDDVTQILLENDEEASQVASPWLWPDGRIIDTRGDHIDLTGQMDFEGYADFQEATGGVRASFHPADANNPEPLVTLHLLEGQQLTPEQFSTVQAFVETHGAQERILLGVQNAREDGTFALIDNPQYQPTRLEDLPRREGLPPADPALQGTLPPEQVTRTGVPIEPVGALDVGPGPGEVQPGRGALTETIETRPRFDDPNFTESGALRQSINDARFQLRQIDRRPIEEGRELFERLTGRQPAEANRNSKRRIRAELERQITRWEERLQAVADEAQREALTESTEDATAEQARADFHATTGERPPANASKSWIQERIDNPGLIEAAEVTPQLAARETEMIQQWSARFGLQVNARVASMGQMRALLNRGRLRDDTPLPESARQTINEVLTALVERRAAGAVIMLDENLVPLGRTETTGNLDRAMVVLREDLSPEARLETLAHEFGHVLSNDRALQITEAEAQSLIKAYRRWLKRNNRPERTVMDLRQDRITVARLIDTMHRVRQGARVQDLPQDVQDFHLSFREFFADNVARWLTQTEQPRTVIQRYFAGIADRLREMFNFLRSRDGVSYRAEREVSGFLRRMWMNSAREVQTHRSVMEAVRAAREAAPEPSAPREEVARRIEKIIGRAPDAPLVHAAMVAAERNHADPNSGISIEAFKRVYKNLLPEDDRMALARYFMRPDVRSQMAEKLDFASMAAIDRGNARMAVTHGFLFWQNGDITVTERPGGILRRLANTLREIFGIMGQHTQAQQVLEAIQSHAVAGQSTYSADQGRSAIQRFREANRLERVGAEVVRQYDRIMPVVRRLWAVQSEIMLFDNPVLSSITNAFKPFVGDARVPQTYFEARMQRQSQFDNRIFRATADLTREEAGQVLELLQDPNRARGDDKIGRAANEINQILRAMRTYAVNRGVRMGDLGPRYFPWVFDPTMVMDHRAELVNLIAQEKYNEELAGLVPGNQLQAMLGEDGQLTQESRELIAGRFVDNIIDQDGLADTEIADTVFTPAFDGANMRQLAFLQGEKATAAETAQLSKFFSKDLGYTLAVYNEQLVKRAEFTSRFGAAGAGLERQFARARELGATEKQIERTRDFVKAMMGSYGRQRLAPPLQFIIETTGKFFGQDWSNLNPRTIRRLQGYMLVYQNLRTLALATLTSLADTGGIAVRSNDPTIAMHAFREGLREIHAGIRARTNGDRQAMQTELQRLAETLGTIDMNLINEAIGETYGGQHLAGRSRRINDKFFEIIQLKRWTRFSRLMGLAAARQFLLRHRTGAYSRHSQRFLEELGLTDGDILTSEDGTQLIVLDDSQREALAAERTEALREEDTARAEEIRQELMRDQRVRTALNRFVDESVMRPNAAQRPLWASHPDASLVFHLKMFAFSIHQQIVRRVLSEAGHGNYFPLGAIWTYPAVMVAADLLREMIQFGPDGDPRKRNWDFWDYTQEGIHRSGMTGMGSFLLDAHKDRTQFGGVGWESAQGPTLSQLSQISSAVRGDRPLMRVATDAIPTSNLWKNWDLDMSQIEERPMDEQLEAIGSWRV